MTVEAPAAKESSWLEAALVSQAVRAAASVAVATGVVGIAASRLEPMPATTPLINAPGRAYYLLALAIALIATLVAHGFSFNRRTLLESHIAAAVLLSVGAATLVFVTHRPPPTILLVAALVGFTLYSATSTRQEPSTTARSLIWYAPVIITLFLLIGGLLEFRLRTLYAAPVASLAGVLALRQLSNGEHGLESKLSGAMVVIVISTEMVWALGFLNISTWLAAALWMAAFLAVLYGLSSSAVGIQRS